MEDEGECSKCGSERIVPRADLLYYDSAVQGALQAGIDQKPGALLFRGQVTRVLKALVCGDCGYAELYVEEPQALYQAYVNAKDKP